MTCGWKLSRSEVKSRKSASAINDHVEHAAGGSALMNKRKITPPPTTAHAHGKLNWQRAQEHLGAGAGVLNKAAEATIKWIRSCST